MLPRLKRWSSLKHYTWSFERPFDGKGKGILKAKALRWQMQEHFEGNGPSMARAKAFEAKGKGTLKTKALRRQSPFDGKSPSLAKVTSRANAKARRGQSEGHFEGNGPFDGKSKGTLKAKAL
jgi:hypothetical protein